MQQCCPLYRDSTVLSDSRVKTILGVIHHWNNFPGGSFPRRHLLKGHLHRRQIIQKEIFLGVNSRRILSGSNYPGEIIQGTITCGVIARGGGNHPGGSFQSGLLDFISISVSFSSVEKIIKVK